MPASEVIEMQCLWLRRLIKYIPQRLEHRDRWVGALQNTEVPLMLINGPADPISGVHAAEGWELNFQFALLPCGNWLPDSSVHIGKYI